MDYNLLSEQLVKNCLKKGADAAEVFLQSQRDLNIEVRNQEIESIQESATHGVGFRVFVKGSLGFAHCNNFEEKALENTLKSAIEFAKNTTPDENNILPENAEVVAVAGLYDPQIRQISMDQKIALIKSAENLALKDPRITKSAGSSYGETEIEVFLANSNGQVKSYQTSQCYYVASVVAEKGEQKSSGYDYATRRFFSDLPGAEAIAAKAAKKAYEMLDPRIVKTQRVPVIFDPEVAFSLLGGILGAINGENVIQGASFLGDKLNQKIAAETITLIDDGVRAKGLGSQPFDDEGVPTQKRVIVENGVLKGFLYNTVVAKRAGTQSTGNATRGGFNALPTIGAHNFYIAAGTLSPEEIIYRTKNGLLVTGVTGYGINRVNGHFSGGASGFWIENGKIAFPVKGLTIAGTAQEMFNAIDMLGTDLDLNRTLTMPTLRIAEMQVGGE
jgi:PmbA protein